MLSDKTHLLWSNRLTKPVSFHLLKKGGIFTEMWSFFNYTHIESANFNLRRQNAKHNDCIKNTTEKNNKSCIRKQKGQNIG